jgi:hypothetical protein
MPRFVTSTVTEILRERPGLQRVATGEGRAYVLTDLVGPVAPGDGVVLNTTAVDLGLGTGGGTSCTGTWPATSGRSRGPATS